MELKVTEVQDLKPIDFNYEELKKELQIKANEYKSIVYTEETIKNAKEDRAKLNKLAKALNDKRIEIKKEVLKPFENFDAKVTELIKITQDASESVDVQVKEFEKKKKDEKLKDIVDFFGENVGELVDVLNFDKIYNEKWLNVTYKIEDIKEEISKTLNKTKMDLKVIEDMHSEFDMQLKDIYLKTLNLTETLAEKTRLEEQKKKLEEMKHKEEITKGIQNSTQNIQNVTNNVEMQTQNEELQQIDFRVWVTQKQKFQLREFFIENKIKYGSIPKQ